MSLTIGIDPGAAGAIAVLDYDGSLVDVIDMPTVIVKVGKGNRTRIVPSQIAAELRRLDIEHAYVERVGAMPGQGSASMFSFGYAAGAVDGVIATLGFPTTFITPASWKRGMQVTSDKGGCRQRAMQLFPMQAALFKRVKDDGRAEAALIARFGMTRHRPGEAGA